MDKGFEFLNQDMSSDEYWFLDNEEEEAERREQERLTKMIKRHFNDDSIKVIFLPNDAPCPTPPIDYLHCDPKLRYYIGYIVMKNGVKIPFIAETIPGDVGYVYLNPHKDFYLAFMIGDLD